MDRLVVESDPAVGSDAAGDAELQTRRRCVSCGYTDTLSATASREPRNRLDGGLKRSDSETGAQVVRLIDPANPAGIPEPDSERDPDDAG
jgi:hypothetical protein